MPASQLCGVIAMRLLLNRRRWQDIGSIFSWSEKQAQTTLKKKETQKQYISEVAPT